MTTAMTHLSSLPRPSDSAETQSSQSANRACRSSVTRLVRYTPPRRRSSSDTANKRVQNKHGTSRASLRVASLSQRATYQMELWRP
ncbi:hypothetical protein CC1G_15702 [Coprinopsis cinerea okayama7|uniref:Uncharacterized protein n=1 Tax=Coprinopsis cinerea (strain Okayama-7 / 130 / ATCC MYA-4618 / FGSC 9003) TaxID=240176 RepID=D6RQG3_COPC7|nr:hypothetical protein CC1G_15702 [Coprinopsis cinerea okayama7\|eukprot:XP_002910273.1 hypothetical protein CC1G_15702 [Coprinopsis cinerea okayama7\